MSQFNGTEILCYDCGNVILYLNTTSLMTGCDLDIIELG